MSLIIIFVAISSYLLGQYSVANPSPSGPLEIQYTNTPKAQSTTTEDISNNVPEASGQVVASKSGKKYYLPWCKAAERISPANRVYFASAKDAEQAGLSKATNCKGMN